MELDLHVDPDTLNSSVERRHFMHIKIGGSPEEARDPPKKGNMAHAMTNVCIVCK